MDQQLHDVLVVNERLRKVVNALRRRVKHSSNCDLVATWGLDKTEPCSCGLRALIDEAKEALNETC